jgi:hypothetical protein
LHLNEKFSCTFPVKVKEEVESQPQSTLTYDELRQRNRQEYERTVVSQQSPYRQRPFPVQQPPQADSHQQAAPTAAPAPEQRSQAIWDSPSPRSPRSAGIVIKIFKRKKKKRKKNPTWGCM